MVNWKSPIACPTPVAYALALRELNSHWLTEENFFDWFVVLLLHDIIRIAYPTEADSISLRELPLDVLRDYHRYAREFIGFEIHN